MKEVLSNLEMSPDSFDSVSKCRDFRLASKNLDLFKSDVRKKRRQLAKKYHPDISGDVNSSRMQLINHMVEIVEKLAIRPPIRRPLPGITMVFQHRSGNGAVSFTMRTQFNSARH